MAATVPKACTLCAKAKRRCGRQKPYCDRCKTKGIKCTYPPSLPSRFVLMQEPTTLDQGPETAINWTGLNDTNNRNNMSPFSLLFDFPTPMPSPHASTPTETWFLSPETWIIDKPPTRHICSFGLFVLKPYVALLQHWLEQWVESGSNPFLHSYLYHTRFPGSLQIAYVTLSSYVHRSKKNTDMVLRIMQDRADELLRDNGVVFDDFGIGIRPQVESLGILEQPARLHALMVYEIVGLFDGDIRSRHIAEGHISVLSSWAAQLVESARQAFSQYSPVTDVSELSLLYSPVSSSSTSNLERQWHAWILAESVRRTWQTAMGVYSLYFIMQQGCTLCPSGVMFTNAEGVWAADSAGEFEKLCAGGDVRFMRRFDAERIFTEAKPSEIDEFGKFMLEITFGPEKMKNWTS